MDAYKALAIHNIGIMALTGFVFIFSDCNFWSLLILFGLMKLTKSKDEESNDELKSINE